MTANEKRALAVEYMTSREKKNSYTQGSNRKYFFGKPDNKPGNRTQKGYSDCSSAVRAAIKAAAGIDIGSNTSAQINNRTKGLIVDETSGNQPNEANLKPGDCLYFKGNKSHPMSVGHVEMYIGDGKVAGHGSGTGPKIRSMKDYCNSRTGSSRYFMAIRWILDDDSDGGRPTLKKGSYGAFVTELQNMLLQLGFNLGSYGVDGDFGEDTEAAVLAFQANNKLQETGIVDADDWAKLDDLMDNEGDADEGNEDANTGIDVPAGDLLVRDGSWNVRTGPGVEFAIAKTVRGGDKLEEVDTQGWKPVMVGGSVCWISPKALK